MLCPLMVSAGFHAINDIAGNDSSSWKNRLMNAGLEVETFLFGLGSIREIQELYVAHTVRAMKSLNG